jgi:hypothetical protein
MTAEEAAKMKPILDETYGKVVYFWQLGDPAPMEQKNYHSLQEK